MRIEAGSDDDEGTTTGAGGVSRAVRLAVRIEAERDDDDAAMTGAGGVSRAVRIAVRIEGRRRSFLWLPFVATVCGYRLWLPMWLPMWLQPPGALTVSLPGALTVAAALQARSLQPRGPHNRCRPPTVPYSRCSPPGPHSRCSPPGALTARGRRSPSSRCSLMGKRDDDATCSQPVWWVHRPGDVATKANR